MAIFKRASFDVTRFFPSRQLAFPAESGETTARMVPLMRLRVASQKTPIQVPLAVAESAISSLMRRKSAVALSH